MSLSLVVPSESSSHEERRDPLEDLAWPPKVLEGCPLVLLMGKATLPPLEEPGAPGGASPRVVISLASTASETLTLELITTPEDEAIAASCDKEMSELCMKSLAGSFREGTLRCILDITEAYPDRPAEMYNIARGQCRSLSEDPCRSKQWGGPTAIVSPKSFLPIP